MCIIAYDLFGNVKRKRCNEVHQNSEQICSTNWAPPCLIQHFCISPTYTVYYLRNVERSPGHKVSILPKTNKHDGAMSKKAGRKIRYCFNWLIASSKVKSVYSKATGKSSFFKLNFITLTLAEKQKHSDNYVKEKMLSAFIQWLQRRHGVVSYIWKAETQVNGNIHFHITTNKFVHWRQIRHKWNAIQYSHGYTRNMMQEEFIRDTNGTDVKPVKKESELIGYMVKYFTKNDTRIKTDKIKPEKLKLLRKLEGVVFETNELGIEYLIKRPVVGRLWNHSANLLTSGFSIDETDSAYSDWRQMLNYYATGNPITTDFATILPHRRVGVKEMPSSVRVLLQNKIDQINAKDRHQSLYVVESL